MLRSLCVRSAMLQLSMMTENKTQALAAAARASIYQKYQLTKSDRHEIYYNIMYFMLGKKVDTKSNDNKNKMLF